VPSRNYGVTLFQRKNASRKENFHMPVGRVQFMYIRPFSFIEYLMAANEIQLSEFIQTVQLRDGIPPVIHKRLLTLMHEYMIVDGMPPG